MSPVGDASRTEVTRPCLTRGCASGRSCVINITLLSRMICEKSPCGEAEFTLYSIFEAQIRVYFFNAHSTGDSGDPASPCGGGDSAFQCEPNGCVRVLPSLLAHLLLPLSQRQQILHTIPCRLGPEHLGRATAQFGRVGLVTNCSCPGWLELSLLNHCNIGKY